MDISRTDQFLALDEKEMKWLVDNKEIVASEAAVLDGLARWYKHSEHQREEAFKQCFDRLNLSVIGKDVLWQLVKRYRLHKVFPDLLHYKVSKFLSYRADVDELIYEENLTNVALLDTLPQVVTCCSGAANDTATYHNEFYGAINCRMPLISKNTAIDLNEITLEGDSLLLESGCYIVPYRESVYIIGATEVEMDDGPSIQQINITLDLHSKTFERRCPPSMPIHPKALTATCGMFVFLLGGVDSGDLSSTVYRYDTVSDKWDEAAPMIYDHSMKHKLAVEMVLSYQNRYLYVFGQHCEKYDMCSNSWTLVVSPWERGVYCHNGHIFNDKIYICAIPREQPVYRCFVYDIRNNTWQEPFSQVPYCFRTTSFFGKNFALLREKIGLTTRRPASSKQPTINSLCLRFAELKLEEGKFKLCKIKEFGSIVGDHYGPTETFHLMIMSRRMRVLLEQ